MFLEQGGGLELPTSDVWSKLWSPESDQAGLPWPLPSPHASHWACWVTLTPQSLSHRPWGLAPHPCSCPQGGFSAGPSEQESYSSSPTFLPLPAPRPP